VTTANVSDREGAIAMFSQPYCTSSRLEKILVDGAYTGEDFADKIKVLVGAEVEVVKRTELHTFLPAGQAGVVIPKRPACRLAGGLLSVLSVG
jgi:hypothetical protein